jgi:hypothetical protein
MMPEMSKKIDGDFKNTYAEESACLTVDVYVSLNY